MMVLSSQGELSDVVCMPTQTNGRILSSRNGKAWRDLGGEVYASSQPYRTAYYNGWHYLADGANSENIVKTKDFVAFTDLVGVTYNKYNGGSNCFGGIVCTQNGIFYRLAYGSAGLELLKSTDLCQTWNNAGLIYYRGLLNNGNFDQSICGIVIGDSKIVITAPFFGSPQSYVGYFCNLNGFVPNEYLTPNNRVNGGADFALPSSSLFANGRYYFSGGEGAIIWIDESLLTVGGSNIASGLFIVSSQGEVTAIGYSEKIDTLVVACTEYYQGGFDKELIIFYKQGNGAFIRSPMPLKLSTPQFMSCIGLKNGGFALSYRRNSNIGAAQGGILHSPDGITWTQVLAEGAYQYLGGLFNKT